jgi:NADPH-dependent glutamate synthase beta subunit-like oxidoreductase/Pyruvate/2-oxoacid:ferredoxin oxidoreductase delta subunit
MGNEDLKEFVIPISYGSTETIETGKWSSRKPETRPMIPPCREACPAGSDISLFIHLVEKGKYAEALSTILAENPFPGVCGRVCFHPCETDCNRAHYDESVSIQMLERFVSSLRSRNLPILQPIPSADPRKVAIVGSGPAGLSCAYFVALLGHYPTIFEAKDEPGGVMRWGIPPFRLPKTVLKNEIRRILALPIELRKGCRVGRDISFEELDRFDAVFLSPGAELNALLSVEGENLPGVWNGGEFLHGINYGKSISLGAETLVIGGGNTAMDVARSALRLGSKVTVAYRRTRDAMPAIRDEVHEAEEEGILFHYLVQPSSIRHTNNGRLAVVFQRMELSTPDDSGRPRAVPKNGEFLTMETDSLISAVGELVDLSWIPAKLLKSGLIDPGSASRFFTGGDAASQPRTIVNAIASAKKAAILMDLSFRAIEDEDILSKIRIGNKGSVSMRAYLQARESGAWPEIKDVVPHEKIHTLYIEQSGRVKPRKLGQKKRLQTFLEVNLHPDARRAVLSASRCYSCGRCNGCLNCYYFCPEGVIAVDTEQCTRTVDYAHCKGCATCVTACPRNAVGMKDLS